MAEEKEFEPTDDEALFKRLQTWFKDARQHSDVWRTDAVEDFKFVAGDQWDADDLTKLKDQLRPAVTFNRISPVIDTVAGLEVTNRQEVRALPREMHDQGVSEVITEAIRWVRDECDAEDEESDAFLDAVICGMGWTESRMDYETDPDGMILIERVDPMEMYWDANSRRRNLDDAKAVFRVRQVDREEAESMFPDASEEDLNAQWASPNIDDSERSTREEDAFYKDDGSRSVSTRSRVTIVEAQWWQREPYYRVLDPQSGQMQEFDAQSFKTLSERAQEIGLPIRSVKSMKRVYKRAFLGAKILEAAGCPCDSGFTFKCITGKRDRAKGHWYGIVRGMKDPQRWANKWLSQTLHIINSNAKGGVIAERDAFDNPRKAEKDWSNPTAITFVKPGKLGAIRDKPQTPYPASIANLMEFAITSIRDVSGVSQELMGSRETDQPASLEYQRRQAGVTVLSWIFDSLRKYRKEQGRLLIEYIRKYLSDGRKIRILGDDGAQQYIPLMAMPDTLKYDIVVDEAPMSPNQKEVAWSAIVQLMPQLARAPIPPDAWIELLKYSPLPETVVQKIGASIQQAQAQQAQNPMQQLQVQEKQADIGVKISESAKDRAAANLANAKAKQHSVETALTAAQAFFPVMGM